MTGIALGVLEERNLELGPKAAKKSKWKNWRLTRDKSDTAWLILDKQGSSANILSMDVLRELSEIIAELETNPSKGLVIRSGKTSGFVAGADITEFGVLTDEDQIATMLTEGNVIPSGVTNALTDVFGVTPLTLGEGLGRLVDTMPERLPSEGTGSLERQRFWADIRGAVRTDVHALLLRRRQA